MRRLSLSAVVLSSLALVSCSSTGPESADDPLGTAASAIAYGTADTTHTAVVAILGSIADGFVECSGTVVQVKGTVGYVLTAAHCCNTGSPDVVVLGDDYAAAAAAFAQGVPPTAPAYAVTAGSAHYDALYDPSAAAPDHDFCMFTFAAPADTAVIPVAQPGEDGLTLGAEVEHVGFGVTDTSTSNTGRRTATAPADLQLTAALLESSEGGSAHVPGTCDGDSGGPALTPAGAAQSQQRVAGTTSFGNGPTCTANTSDVCSRVSSETGPSGFITSFLNDAPSGTVAPASCDMCEATAQGGTCQMLVAACLDEATCSALAGCVGTCTTQACATSCETTAGPTATAAFNAANNCIAAACPQCTASTAGSGAGGGSAGSSSSHGCSVSGTPERGPLAPWVGLLLGAALLGSRRRPRRMSRDALGRPAGYRMSRDALGRPAGYRMSRDALGRPAGCRMSRTLTDVPQDVACRGTLSGVPQDDACRGTLSGVPQDDACRGTLSGVPQDDAQGTDARYAAHALRTPSAYCCICV